MRVLMLTLHAPLASYGDTAMGRRRTSWTRPARSAVIGMVAAALGIDREDHDSLAALTSGLGYAVRTDATGASMTDYHTAAVGQGREAQNARTRRYELAGEAKTIPSHREYREDSLHTVALWDQGSPWSLDQIAEAIRHPHWIIYIGRRACVPSLPLNPEIIEAETLREAFALRPALPEEIAAALSIRLNSHPEIAADENAPGLEPSRIERRRDIYNRRRSFRERAEWITEASS